MQSIKDLKSRNQYNKSWGHSPVYMAVAIFGRWVHSGGVGVATKQMIYFSTRKRLEELYKEWLKENPTIKDCPFNVITFLSAYLDEQKIAEKIGNPVLRKSNLP